SSKAKFPIPLEAGSGASASVDNTPNASPSASINPLPESPGMPGVSVYAFWDQPSPVLPRLNPDLGCRISIPARNEELPMLKMRSPAEVPVEARPSGPPQNGTVGFTSPTNSGST